MLEASSLCLYLLLLSAEFHSNNVVSAQQVFGVGPEGDRATQVGGVVTVTDGVMGFVRLFGDSLTNATVMKLTKSPNKCTEDLSTRLELTEVTNQTAVVQINSETHKVMTGTNYICLSVSGSTVGTESLTYEHQGEEKWLRIDVIVETSGLLPLEVQILFIVVCMVLSGLFSGLNLGLMSLDPTELKVVMRSGSKREKQYAAKIEPIRRHGNYLLCTLLLGNVLVNSTFTILLDNLTGSGIIAVIASTAGIVVMGEIIPQSICSRYGLAVGAYTVWLTWIFMIITFPLSYPVSRILDWILGDEIGRVYNRTQLLELVRVTGQHTDLVEDEVGMLSGVLGFKTKTVSDIMTKIDDAYLLDVNSVLDFRTISDILQHGHSRIPVYRDERSQIIGLLFARDLSLLDPDDRIPLQTIIKYYNHELLRVPHDMSLDKMLDAFKDGSGHMAAVQAVNDSTEGDPFYETLGIVTLEDIIEEIIQFEIVDESDIILDNKSRKPIDREPMDLSYFQNLNSDASEETRLSSQLLLAVFQFLTAEVKFFGSDVISGHVLRRLISKPGIAEEICVNDHDAASRFIYRKDHVANFFVLLLQGRARVTIGQENLAFDAGPFSYFGVQALAPVYESRVFLSKPSPKPSSTPHIPRSYYPDFSLEIVSDVQLVRITRAQYIAALKSTEFEMTVKDEKEQERFFQQEMAQADEQRRRDEASRTSSQNSSRRTRKWSKHVEESLSPSTDDEMSDERSSPPVNVKAGKVRFAPNGDVDCVISTTNETTKPDFGETEL